MKRGKEGEKRDMQMDQITIDWRKLRGKVKDKWRKLTDEDLDVINGKRSALIEKLQQRYSRSRDVTEKEVDKWIGSL